MSRLSLLAVLLSLLAIVAAQSLGQPPTGPTSMDTFNNAISKAAGDLSMGDISVSVSQTVSCTVGVSTPSPVVMTVPRGG